MIHPLVEKISAKLLPEFEEAAKRIRQDFPNVKVEVSGNAIGSKTTYKGYSFWLDCLIEDYYDKEDDNVWVEVGLGHLTTVPKIMAESDRKCFRNFDGSFPSEGIELTDEILEELYNFLPRLYEDLVDGIQRRISHNK
jgi:hypothetical protein